MRLEEEEEEVATVRWRWGEEKRPTCFCYTTHFPLFLMGYWWGGRGGGPPPNPFLPPSPPFPVRPPSPRRCVHATLLPRTAAGGGEVLGGIE